jgi:hypothetical protein
MFSFLRQPSRSATGAIRYVTVGVLLMIWAGLWYWYWIRGNPNAERWQEFTCVGILLSGVAVTVIGLLFGTIGGGAKQADNTVGVATTTPAVPATVGAPAGGVVPAAAGMPVANVAAPVTMPPAPPPGTVQPAVVR